MQGGELGSDNPVCGSETRVGLALFVLLIQECSGVGVQLGLPVSPRKPSLFEIFKNCYLFLLYFFCLLACGIPSFLTRDQT